MDLNNSLYSNSSFNKNGYSLYDLNGKTQRFKKIETPKNQDLINLILNIDKKIISPNIVNNIYNVALSFPLLISNKDRTYSLESSFIASKNDIQFQKFDSKKLEPYFKKSNKFLIQLIKSCKVNDLKREISGLCFLIILYSIQDRTKKFKIFKKFFRGIIQETDFLKNYLVDKQYLNKLRKEIRNHEHRTGFASTVVETIYKYNTKDLNKKCEPKRQRKLINFIKKFFYLNRICSALEQIQLEKCGNELFFTSLKILDGPDIESEKNNYNDIWDRIQSKSSNHQDRKKKIAYLFERLFSNNNLMKYKLIENIKIISFFIGLLNLTPDFFKEKIRSNQIDDKFYALGILLKRFLILIQIKRQIEVAKKENKELTISWLNKFLDILSDESVSKYPAILSQGLKRIKYDESFLKNQYRKDLYSTINRIEILKNASQNVEEMSIYLDRFLIEQTVVLSINKLEYIKHFADDQFIHSIDEIDIDPSDEIKFESLEKGWNIFNSSTTKFNYSNDDIATDLSIQAKKPTKRILSIKNEKINNQSTKKEKINNQSTKKEKINNKSTKKEKINDQSIKKENRSEKHNLDNSHNGRPFKRIRENYDDSCDENSENKFKIKKQKSKANNMDVIILDDDENEEINQQVQIQNNDLNAKKNSKMSAKINNKLDSNNNQSIDEIELELDSDKDSDKASDNGSDNFWVQME